MSKFTSSNETDVDLVDAIEKLASMNIDAQGLPRSEIISLYEDIMLANEEYKYESDHSYDEYSDENKNQEINTENDTVKEALMNLPITDSVAQPDVGKAEQFEAYHIQENKAKIDRVSEMIYVSNEKAFDLLQLSNWDEIAAISLHLDVSSSETHSVSNDIGVQRDLSPVESNTIRAPDKVVVSQLLDESRIPVSRALLMRRKKDLEEQDWKEENANWMVTLPEKVPFLNSKLLFQDARDLALRSRMYLLVNIQFSESWDCNNMNRDTWTDETVTDIINSYFIFWQRGVTSQGGSAFLRIYDIYRTAGQSDPLRVFPGIYIIDPRTGALEKSISRRGLISAADIAEILIAWTEKHSTSEWGQWIDPNCIDSTKNSDVVETVTDFNKTDVDNTEVNKSLSSTRVSYGNIVPAPDASEPGTCKIMFKTSTGPQVRLFRQTDTVESVFAVALSFEPGADDIDILFTSGTATINFKSSLHLTIGEVKLGGSKVVIRRI